MVARPHVRSVVIAGARPNFVKVAPLLRALEASGSQALLVHTGQHYDATMSDALFRDLDIPAPDVNLGVGSGTHAVQTASVMTTFESWLEANPADHVVTVGDVNSTLACTLVAAKRGLPVAHVEAGLRSFDRTMPEEINRLVVDALATWLFTPSMDANDNLLAEGVDPTRIHLVGNIMVDSLLASLEKARSSPIRRSLDIEGRFGLVTLHRPALVDSPDALAGVVSALDDIASELPLVFPAHPRTRKRMEENGIAVDPQRVLLIDPLGYLDFLLLEAEASLVLTDSGGIQEETTILGVPCLTLRENTERPITITHGTNTLVGLDPDAIRRAAERVLRGNARPSAPPLWDGRTSERIASILLLGTPEVSWLPPSRQATSRHGVDERPLDGQRPIGPKSTHG
jgi:UDP-N-acetylglucosamine 2-epimerase (non-hydrolysing)